MEHIDDAWTIKGLRQLKYAYLIIYKEIRI